MANIHLANEGVEAPTTKRDSLELFSRIRTNETYC